MYDDRCPYRYKWQLVDWAATYFGDTKTKYNNMSKSQLYAIFYSIRRKKVN